MIDIKRERRNIAPAVTTTILFMFAFLSGGSQPAHICLGISIASLSLLMVEKEWTGKSITAFILNLVALALCFWLMIR